MTSQNATAAQARGLLAQTKEATATGYNAFTQEVPKADLASSQLNDITSQDSPLMKRARQEGILSAAKRGLQNSSIAAGAAQGAIVDRATPLAQTNAQQLSQQSLANQAAINQAREVSTGRETDISSLNAQLGTGTSQFNAGQQNEIAKLNAQMQTAVSQGNAAAANEIALRLEELKTGTSQFNAQQQNELSKLQAQIDTAVSQGNAELETQLRTRMAELQTQVNLENAAAENRMREGVLQANVELNKQYLANTGAVDLASIQGMYNQLISTNETAANLYNSYFNSIAQAMANKDIPPDRIAQYVQVQQSMLEAGLRMMDKMNGLDLGDFQMPDIVVSGTGQGSAITPVPPGSTGATGEGEGGASGAGGTGGPPINIGTIDVGGTQLPATVEFIKNGVNYGHTTGGENATFEVWNNGERIGTLSPGGKNGRYVPVNPVGTGSIGGVRGAIGG